MVCTHTGCQVHQADAELQGVPQLDRKNVDAEVGLEEEI